MFQRAHGRPTPAGLASYDRLRRLMRGIADAGRLVPPIEDATAAFWSSVHGVTSLVIAGLLSRRAAAIAIVRDAMAAEITRSAAPRRGVKRAHRKSKGERDGDA
jgi:hypothetical protein